MTVGVWFCTPMNSTKMMCKHTHIHLCIKYTSTTVQLPLTVLAIPRSTQLLVEYVQPSSNQGELKKCNNLQLTMKSVSLGVCGVGGWTSASPKLLLG